MKRTNSDYSLILSIKQYSILKTIVIDNYDSFTYNLVRYIHIITGEEPTVVRNDAFEIDFIDQFDVIVFSPGPGLPENAGLMLKVIERYYKTKKMLGVCLGHQALGVFFGSKLKQLEEVKHGISTPLIIKSNDFLYKDISNQTLIGRYHSWVIDKESISDSLIVTSTTDDNVIMGIRHEKYPIYGVQYHPESILTTEGLKIIKNFYQI